MKTLKRYKYLGCILTPIIIGLSILSNNLWTYFPLFFFFICIPLIELLTRADTTNLSSEEESLAQSTSFYNYILYFFVPCQILILGIFLNTIRYSSDAYEYIGKIICMGIACGIMGINVAHELGHRSTWYEKFMSKLLLLTSLYMHFFIEHNYGHHLNVATHDDPATARKGESLYGFHLRSIISGWLSAWKIQGKMLLWKKRNFFSIYNEMLLFSIIQVSLLVIIYIVFDFKTTLAFVAAALIGILLLETVNYIEHYGLTRKRKSNGNYEPTQPVHSWNSNHPLGRILLFELSRHSDHHYKTSRKYQILRHFENSPQMPTGYPGMMILSLWPPLWFSIMDRILDRFLKNEPTNSST